MSFLRKYLFLFILISPFYSQAQSNCNLSLKGRILDADTKLPLAGSTIHLLQGNLTKQSDGHGFFSFEKLCSGDYVLQISALGFENIELKIKLTKNTQNYDIMLEHEAI